MTLLKNISLLLVIVCGTAPLSSYAYVEESVEQVVASTDVKATMKRMSFTYKEAMEATDIGVMQNTISELKNLISTVQLVEFAEERQQILQQGLTELQTQLDLVNKTLVAGNITMAKQQLENIMALKKQYHKERSPSLWQLIFGK